MHGCACGPAASQATAYALPLVAPSSARPASVCVRRPVHGTQVDKFSRWGAMEEVEEESSEEEEEEEEEQEGGEAGGEADMDGEGARDVRKKRPTVALRALLHIATPCNSFPERLIGSSLEEVNAVRALYNPNHVCRQPARPSPLPTTPEDAMQAGIASGLQSGLVSGLASGIASSLPSGIETPDTFNLRKDAEGPRQLYTVLEQKQVREGGQGVQGQGAGTSVWAWGKGWICRPCQH